MKLVLLAIAVGIVLGVNAQPKMLPAEAPTLRYSCDEQSGVCSMMARDLLAIVELAQRECK